MWNRSIGRVLRQDQAFRATVAVGAVTNLVLLVVATKVASVGEGPVRWVFLGGLAILFALPAGLLGLRRAQPSERAANGSVAEELAAHLGAVLASAEAGLHDHDPERLLDVAATAFAQFGFDRAEILTVDDDGRWDVIRTVDYLPTTRTFTAELIPVPTDGKMRQLETAEVAALCWQGRGVAELVAYRVWTTRGAHRLPGMLGALRSMTALVERSLEACVEADPTAQAA